MNASRCACASVIHSVVPIWEEFVKERVRSRCQQRFVDEEYAYIVDCD